MTENSLLNKVYPVGSIYISLNNTNPGTFIGGTWEAFGAGRTLVSVDSNDSDFNASNKTGGSKTVTLTVDQMPSHTHSWNGYRSLDHDAGDAARQAISAQRFNNDPTQSGTINSTGGGKAHNNLQPYITVYMFRRTA